MIIRLLLSLFVLFACQVSAQVSELRLSRILNWYNEQQLTGEGLQAGFEGAVYTGETLDIPVFMESIALPTGWRGAEVTIANISTLVSSGRAALQWNLATEFELFHTVSKGDEGMVLEIRLVPLRRAAGLELLKSFDLIVTPSEPQARNQRGGLTFADHSVLAEGTWYKMAIARDGIYKIDFAFLQSMGINPAIVNPKKINIYGNGGAQLPIANNADRADDLRKNAIYVAGEDDEQFNANDYVLFYGQGPDSWTYSTDRFIHHKHQYSDSAYYFIRIDDIEPKRVSMVNQPSEPETHTVSTFNDYQFVENELTNLANSGREFYGETFDLNTSSTYTFSFPNISSQSPVLVEFLVAARSPGASSTFNVSVGGSGASASPAQTGTSATSNFANLASNSFSFTSASSNLAVNVQFEKASASAIGWLDFIRVNCRRNLQMQGTQLRFRDAASVGPGNIALYSLQQASGLWQIWDITDPANATRREHVLNGSTATFRAPSDELREYIAFNNGGFLTPVAQGAVANQDLHGITQADLVIVSAPRLLQAASQLAEIHKAEGLNVLLTTPVEVFNEFSSGNPDVTAIKMLMKMFYDRAAGDPDLEPQNLLLFGDGSYFNRNLAYHKGNNVICYQSVNSISPVASYVSDDYFVFLEDSDSEALTNTLDCGVGRIPASDITEALGYLNKIKRYIADNTHPQGAASCLGDQEQTPYGSWRNITVFVSDDQDGNGIANEWVHMLQSEELADTIYTYFNDYDVVKIYMDAYKQEVTAGGERYPEGEAAIRQRVENGALLVTYIGHGGERGWAHERILNIPTIQNWTNLNRLPVFLTATCELARYDDPAFKSAGELLIMNPKGGGIAMLTTTRIVYSGGNMLIDRAFFKHVFRQEQIPKLTLGKLNRLTKNGVTSSDENKRNFSLLGDPALRMSYPQEKVYTTHVNDEPLKTFNSTLKALQEVEFKGYVGDADGNKLTSFNGFVYPTVYDKRAELKSLNNDLDGTNFPFSVFNRVLYKGKASVTAGEFSFRFVVPYDINYSVGNGRVSYYAVAGNTDAHGHTEQFLIGGALENAELNTIGPEISLFLNDTTFVSGGITNQAPLILAKLKDENGINTAGNGIGHDLLAILDGNQQNPIVLNDYYQADLDTYKSGEIRYALSKLSDGTHTLKLKAWDVHNNSSEASIEFVVASGAELALKHVLNYPNPFTTRTEFMFEHNQACEALDVRIQIFTVGGKLVKTIEQPMTTAGYRSEPIVWNGRDDFGDKIGRGVYVYRVEVRNSQGARAEQFEKLVILN